MISEVREKFDFLLNIEGAGHFTADIIGYLEKLRFLNKAEAHGKFYHRYIGDIGVYAYLQE